MLQLHIQPAEALIPSDRDYLLNRIWPALFSEASHLHFKPWNHICVLKCFQTFYFRLLEPYYVRFTFMHLASKRSVTHSMLSLNDVTASANQFSSSDCITLTSWRSVHLIPTCSVVMCVYWRGTFTYEITSKSPCFSGDFPEDAENNPIWHCERKQTKQDTHCFLI